MLTRRKAFSLLELLAAVVILAILAAAIIPRLITSTGDARIRANDHNQAIINSAVERFTIETGSQPNTIDDLDIPDYFPDGLPDNPVTNLPYSLNPATKRVQE